MICVDRTISLPYAAVVMRKMNGQSHSWLAPVTLIGTILAVVLSFCLIAGSMASQDSCQNLGLAPGLCSKSANHADHLVAAPASPITPLPYQGTSEILFRYVPPTTPSFGFLSTPDGRAPPLV